MARVDGSEERDHKVSNWTALTNFVDDGRIDAHNNTGQRENKTDYFGSPCKGLGVSLRSQTTTNEKRRILLLEVQKRFSSSERVCVNAPSTKTLSCAFKP